MARDYREEGRRARFRMRLLLGPVVLMLLTYIGFSYYWARVIDINCLQYLDRAKTANTIAIAQEELGKAIAYLEDNNLTEGSSAVIYKAPDNDIGFWYKNLKTLHGELLAMDENASALEQSNLLLKLKEVIEGGDRDAVYYPYGISRVPHFRFHGIAIFISVPLVLLLGLAFISSIH